MRLIEIIGANGAGKSTLCNALLEMDRNLIGRDEALRRCAAYWIRHTGSLKRRALLGLLLRLAIRSRSAALLRAVALDHSIGLVNSKRQIHEDFIAAALKLVATNEKRALSRFKAFEWFTRVLDEAIFFAGTPLDDIVVLDESVCHLIYELSRIAGFDPTDVETYFQQVPAPFAIVQVTVSSELHLANVVSRAAMGHVMPGHRDIIHDEDALAADLHNRRRIGEVARTALAGRAVHCIPYRPRADDSQGVVSRINDLSHPCAATR